MNGIIYYIFFNESGKGYVGRHCTTKLYARFTAHCRDNNSVVGKAIHKYGKENAEVILLDTAESDQELNEKEIYWIDKLNTISPNGYNIATGGQGTSGWKLSEETKRAISLLGPLLESTKLKISLSLTGRVVPLHIRKKISETQKGHPVSEDTRKKISEGNKGRIKSPEECKAISMALTGGTLSDETKAKISESLKGIVTWNTGIKTGPFTKEHIKNRVNSLRTITPEQVQAIRKENPYRGHIPWAKELEVTSAAIGKVRRYQAFPDEP